MSVVSRLVICICLIVILSNMTIGYINARRALTSWVDRQISSWWMCLRQTKTKEKSKTKKEQQKKGVGGTITYSCLHARLQTTTKLQIAPKIYTHQNEGWGKCQKAQAGVARVPHRCTKTYQRGLERSKFHSFSLEASKRNSKTRVKGEVIQF